MVCTSRAATGPFRLQLAPRRPHHVRAQPQYCAAARPTCARWSPPGRSGRGWCNTSRASIHRPRPVRPARCTRKLHGMRPASPSTYLGFNMHKPPFDKCRTREALHLVMNQQDRTGNVDGRVEQAAGRVGRRCRATPPPSPPPRPDIGRAPANCGQNRAIIAQARCRASPCTPTAATSARCNRSSRRRSAWRSKSVCKTGRSILPGCTAAMYQAFISGEADSAGTVNLPGGALPLHQPGERDPGAGSTALWTAPPPNQAQRYAPYAIAGAQRAAVP